MNSGIDKKDVQATSVRAVVDAAMKKLEGVDEKAQIERILNELKVDLDEVMEVKKAGDKVNEQAELFKKIEASYDSMVDTLKKFGFNKEQPSTKEIVMEAIKKLSPKQLEAIKKFGKPMICITPAGSLEDKVNAINANKKRDGQGDAYLSKPANNPFWGGDTTKMVVTVVDGMDTLPQPDFITDEMNVGQKMDKYEEEFAKDDMEIMTTQQGAMIMMQSLKDGNPIDDVYRTNTATFYNRKHLTKGSGLPCGCWNSMYARFKFIYDIPDAQNSYLRCRPSVWVMEV